MIISLNNDSPKKAPMKTRSLIFELPRCAQLAGVSNAADRKQGSIKSYSASSPVVAFASPSTEVMPALCAAFFHCSHSARARWHSLLSLSQLVLSSEMACSVSSFSKVHFSMFCVSLSLSCVMNWTARARMLPLFFSQPGTIFAISLMPSLMVSRRRRSTLVESQLLFRNSYC